jgi:hypothetical protein
MSLPGSGSLSMGDSAGAGRGISEEIYGSLTHGSYATLRADAGLSGTGSMTDFYNFNGTPAYPTFVTIVDGSQSVTVSWTNGTEPSNSDNYVWELWENGSFTVSGIATAGESAGKVISLSGCGVGWSAQVKMYGKTLAGRVSAVSNSNILTDTTC